MRPKRKVLIYLGSFLTLLVSFLDAHGAEAKLFAGQGERGKYKSIRAICDSDNGVLIYQAEGVAGPLAAYSGGCQELGPTNHLSAKEKAVVPSDGDYKEIRRICDTDNGAAIYQAAGLAGPVAVAPGGCMVKRLALPTPIPTLPSPAPAPLQTPIPNLPDQ